MKHCIVALGTCISLISAQAQDTIKKLTPVEVIYQAGKNTPVTYQNISAKTLDAKSTGQEPSFLFSTETPSITAASDAGNTQGYSYYRLRGMDQTRVNTTLDGMPLNEPEDQGAYFSNYPDILNSVSRIQIQRGVGTSKNGTSGYAGSIQLFSPDLTDSAKTTFGIGYGSYNSVRAFAEYQSGLKNNKALYVRGSEVYTDGFKHHSSNHSQSIFLSTGIFNKVSTWKMNIMVGHQANELAWRPVETRYIFYDSKANANSPNDKDDFYQGLIQLQHIWQPSAKSTLHTSVYYTGLTGNYDADMSYQPDGQPNEYAIFNAAFKSNFTGIFSNYTFKNNHLSWTTGVHGNIYNRRHTGTQHFFNDADVYRNTGYKNELSAFSKIEYAISRFNLFADVQQRFVSFRYEGSAQLPKLNWAFFNPKAGVNFELNHYTSLYYSIGRNGREPTRNDLFVGYDNIPEYDFAPYSKSEHVTDQELGARLHTKDLNIQLNAYYMNFNGEIAFTGELGSNGLPLATNIESSYRMGVEFSGDYHLLQHFILTNNSSFNKSRIKQPGAGSKTPLLTPAAIVNQEVAYERTHFGVAIAGRYQSESFIGIQNDAIIDNYFILNARAHYTVRHYDISLFVNNLTGQKYYNSGSYTGGIPGFFIQAPANFYVSVKYSF